MTREILKNWTTVTLSVTNRPTMGIKQLQNELLDSPLKTDLFDRMITTLWNLHLKESRAKEQDSKNQ